MEQAAEHGGIVAIHAEDDEVVQWNYELARERGMWFDMGGTGNATFWMHGMRFPIDIVWISDEFVVTGVAERLPFPEPGAPDSALPRYSSGVPIRYVLEINAGLADELGIGEGSVVSITPVS